LIVMLSTTFNEQCYKRPVQLLADFAEKPPTLTHTDSEQHTSTCGSEQTSNQRSIKTRSTTSSTTRSTTSSRSQKDSTRGHSRGLSKGKRKKALLYQRATEILAASGFGTTTLDPTGGKEMHSSASKSRDPQKGAEPESDIVSL